MAYLHRGGHDCISTVTGNDGTAPSTTRKTPPQAPPIAVGDRRSTNDTDGPTSLPANSYDLAAERGPALNDARHRFMSLFNAPLARGFDTR